jgi:hypothetical protein
MRLGARTCPTVPFTGAQEATVWRLAAAARCSRARTQEEPRKNLKSAAVLTFKVLHMAGDALALLCAQLKAL